MKHTAEPVGPTTADDEIEAVAASLRELSFRWCLPLWQVRERVALILETR